MKPSPQYQDIQYGNAAGGLTMSDWLTTPGWPAISGGLTIFARLLIPVGLTISSGKKTFVGIKSLPGRINPTGAFVKLKICTDEDL